MRRTISILLVVVATSFLLAQHAEAAPQESKETASQVGVHAPDAATMATAIRNSYYHPDGISALDCKVLIDWPAFFASMKVNPPADRVKALQGLGIRSEAVRGKSPKLTFDWTDEAFSGKEQLEDGLKQMLGGFYQMYWSMAASPLVDSASGISKIEGLPDGGAKVYSSSENSKVVITVDKESIPTSYMFDSPVLSGTVVVRYAASPKPAPGDIRRISGMDVSDRIGNSTFNIKLDLDYQAVKEFYVPAHASYDLGGAYSLSMEFSGCSVSKGAIADKAK